MLYQSTKMICFFLSICLWTIASFAENISNNIQSQLKTISQKISTVSPDQKLQALQHHLPELNKLAPKVQGLPLFNKALSEGFASKDTTQKLQQSFQTIKNAGSQLSPIQAKELSTQFVESLYDAQTNSPQSPTKMAKARNLLKKLIAQGILLSDLKKNLSQSDADRYQAFVEKLLNNATDKSDSNEEYEKDVKNAIDGFLDLIPPSASPGLSGPSRVFFRDLMVYNNEMWDASTDGLGLVSDAIENGKVDTARLSNITNRLNDLAQKGPWSDSLREFLDKVTEKFPGLNELLEALFPKKKDAGGYCGAINCDCDNLEFGLLSRPYRQECRNAEKSARDNCIKSGGKIVSRCHPTASGPNPTYPK